MALGGVYMTDTDGNIGLESIKLSEKICGLLFDTSAHPQLWTKGAGLQLVSALKDKVLEFNKLDDAVEAGIKPYTGLQDEQSESKDFMHGIPYYHIKHFFDVNGGSGRLFVAFADCSNNWNAIIDMQKAAFGMINQFGVWTEQHLWKKMDESASQYSISLVGDLQAVGESLAKSYNAPASILLSANSAKVKTSSGENSTVTWSEIPTCLVDARYVTVLLGQALDADVTAMQVALDSKTPVGVVGLALGCCAKAKVSESIGWVQQFDLIKQIPDVEFGFGNAEVSGSKLTNSTRYAALSQTQLDTLEEMGYVFLVKYAGLEGHIYFSGDTACSTGDYRTISRNRTINKSRRAVRTALLPYVNSPIKVDPATGNLSGAQIAVFTNLVTDVLNVMATNEEISGIGQVVIPANQNILKNDTLIIQYTIVPIGTAKTIQVTEGLTLKK